jgi:AhpD family alkylhydroperoxidase
MSPLPLPYVRFGERHPALWRAYERLGAEAAASGPLEPRTRALVKLAMAAAAHSESAVESHVHRALELGVSPEELLHALRLGVTTIGFPRTMAALTWAEAAIAHHAGRRPRAATGRRTARRRGGSARSEGRARG